MSTPRTAAFTCPTPLHAHHATFFALRTPGRGAVAGGAEVAPPLRRAVIVAKKAGGGSKGARKRSSSQAKSKPRAKRSAASQSDATRANAPAPTSASEPGPTPAAEHAQAPKDPDGAAEDAVLPDPLAPDRFQMEGPLAPDTFEMEGPLAPEPALHAAERNPVSAPATAAEPSLSDDDPETYPGLPVGDESTLKLPELGVPSGTIRRKRKPLQRTGVSPASSAASDEPAADPFDRDDRIAVPQARVRELTAAYRGGGEEAQKVIDEIEKEPDFLFRTANVSGEYDLTSALFGIGRANKQGIFVLPYLQSGHLLLLAIVSLIALVYYPGFPLTEASDNVRDALKVGMALVLTANAVLASFAWRAAKRRAQPPLFWALKTMLLGDLAYGELRRNTTEVGSQRPTSSPSSKKKKRRGKK